MDKDLQTIEYINKFVLQTLKIFRQSLKDKEISIDKPFIKYNYSFDFDENFEPIFPESHRQLNLNLIMALYKFTKNSAIVLDFAQGEGFLNVYSKDKNFVSITKNLIESKKVFELKDILGHYNHKLKVILNTFRLDNPYDEQEREGKYLLHISPLCINKQTRKGFYHITTGFDFGEFSLNMIYPAQIDNSLNLLIEKFKQTISEILPQENNLFIENLELNSESSQQAADFINKLNKSISIGKISFNSTALAGISSDLQGFDPLTLQIIKLVSEGLSNPIIAERIYKNRTKTQQIKNKLSAIYLDFGIKGDSKGKREKLKEIYIRKFK